MYNLFIIGNGFDLAHGLETSYTHFMEDLIKKVQNDPEKYSDISYFDLKAEKTNILVNGHFKEIDRVFKIRFLELLFSNRHNQNWSDIEFLYFEVLKNYHDKNFMSLTMNSSVKYDSIVEINQDFEIVKKYLSKYLEEEQKRFKKMDTYCKLFEYYNHTTTTVLNFNYTNTIKQYLEDCNDIKLINIHGELNNPDNPIIFGFAANNEESKQLQDKNDNEYLRNIKKFNYNLTNNEYYLKKELDDGKKIEVHILGHSCGVSDKLILSQIFNHKNINSIWVYYYNDMEGYRQTSINIDRIIDDYSKKNKEDYSFQKLNTLPKSCKMLQHNSTTEEIKKNEYQLFFIQKSEPDRKIVGMKAL